MLAPGKDLVQVARVLKANGVDGQAVIGLRGIDAEDLNTEEPVFIYFDGSPVPFFIEEIVPRGLRKALVRLTGIRSEADVEEIAGADVYVEPSSLPDGGEEEGDLSFLVGWTLYDSNPDNPAARGKNSGQGARKEVGNGTGERAGKGAGRAVEVGRITGFADIPGNPCIDVDTKNGAVMIPLHEDLVESVDQDSRTIVMNVPAGLII